MSIEAKLVALLSALHEAFPTDRQLHNITMDKGRLCLTLWTDKRWYSFYINDGDLTKPADQSVEELRNLLTKEKE